MTLDDKVSKYIITTAQRGAPPHKKFIESLESAASYHDAEILILPTNGQAPTSKSSSEDELLHPSLQKHSIVDGDMPIHRDLDIRRFPVKAQQIDPLTGWGRFVQYDKSAIFASPKQRMQVIPNSNTHKPKVLMTTGACTMPHYRDGNWDTKARLDHVFGGILVEANKDAFHYRQLQANTTGRMYDLGIEFAGAATPMYDRAEALVLGDLHTGAINDEVLKATKELIAELRPKYLIIHDLFDAYSISHHHQKQLMIRAAKAKAGGDDLESELNMCGETLDTLQALLPEDGAVIVVKSNHDEFIERYLQEGRFTDDPKNLDLSCKLAQDYLQGADPLERGIEYTHGKVPAVTFLGRDDDFKVRGYQLANHGDLGANGARGSIRSMENSTGKSISGHAHSPQIQRNTWVVGTSTNLQLEYNRGASSWLNTHCALYPHGRPQLINIIDGKYRLD